MVGYIEFIVVTNGSKFSFINDETDTIECVPVTIFLPL